MHDPCQDDSSPDSDGDDMDRISRVPTRNKNVIKHSAVDTVPTNKPTTDNSTTSSLLVSNDNSTMKEMVDLLREIKQGISMIQDGRSKSYTSRRFDKPSTGSSRQGQNTGPHSNNKQSSDYACFRCGDKTHFIRNCPFPMVTGQMNLAMETPIMVNEQENKASPRYTRQQNSRISDVHHDDTNVNLELTKTDYQGSHNVHELNGNTERETIGSNHVNVAAIDLDSKMSMNRTTEYELVVPSEATSQESERVGSDQINAASVQPELAPTTFTAGNNVHESNGNEHLCDNR